MRLRRNLRNHRWTSELLARVLAASFPGKPFSFLASGTPAHRDSTNGPWENLLLACATCEGGGVWVQADEGPAHLQQKDPGPGQGDLDAVDPDPGQPFRLRLISTLLRDASGPDWGVFLEGIEGFPVGIKHPLPRTREVFVPQTKWKLELGAMDVAQSWKANYESARGGGRDLRHCGHSGGRAAREEAGGA